MGRISAYLNALKDKNNLTQRQLADMTGIPVGTLPRYFGALDDDAANFEVVRKLVVAMHGSLDELPGIPLRQAEHDESAYKAVVAGLEARLDEKNDRIRHRAELLDDEQQRSERETRRANRATLIACIIGALFVLLVFIDALIPTRGWILR
ncbi:MAG: helix-turn-helix transcriptional regulator [Clostridiales bacterium]|nr:helix-turn-helix transcriptional regulator [Clostridiales bacterium]